MSSEWRTNRKTGEKYRVPRKYPLSTKVGLYGYGSGEELKLTGVVREDTYDAAHSYHPGDKASVGNLDLYRTDLRRVTDPGWIRSILEIASISGLDWQGNKQDLSRFYDLLLLEVNDDGDYVEIWGVGPKEPAFETPARLLYKKGEGLSVEFP